MPKRKHTNYCSSEAFLGPPIWEPASYWRNEVSIWHNTINNTIIMSSEAAWSEPTATALHWLAGRLHRCYGAGASAWKIFMTITEKLFACNYFLSSHESWPIKLWIKAEPFVKFKLIDLFTILFSYCCLKLSEPCWAFYWALLGHTEGTTTIDFTSSSIILLVHKIG